eukprot:gene3482-3980_t
MACVKLSFIVFLAVFLSAFGSRVRDDVAGNFDYAPDLQNIPQLTGFQLGSFNGYSGQRPGNPSNDHQCDQVGSVPTDLNFITKYNFYYKYTHAYGIPIISSAYVSDAALKRACYVVRVLLADLPKIRYHLYKNYGRAGVIGANEGVTNIPEHSWLPDWWNQRARGLGGTLQYPISTGGEENLLCWNNDRYRNEDIFLHEFSHGIQEIAIVSGAIPGFISRLQSAFNYAKSRGLWANTYAMSTWKEYFAEGVQSYFHVNAYAKPPNGVHNDINTRAKLQAYDPTLYGLIREVFPCGNYIKDRCDRTDNLVSMRMNCDGSSGGASTPAPSTSLTPSVTTKSNHSTVITSQSPRTTTTTISTPPEIIHRQLFLFTVCKDDNQLCYAWASVGYCTTSPGYMLVYCKKSCNVCNNGGASCVDLNQSCQSWATRGECSRNPGYMLVYCRKSCNVC